MKDPKETFFMHIPEPLIVRRAVLESSRETIRFMQQYEQIKSIRTLKAKKILELRRELKEVSRMVQELKAKMPEVAMRKPKHRHVHAPALPAAPQEKKAVQKRQPPKRLNELERLEAELGEVERKLGKLR